MTYWRLHYHLIWATFDREPSLLADREKVLYGVIYNKGKELGLKIHAVGNIENHVHVVASIPPNLAVAECIRHIKGASAYAINCMSGSDEKFKWQSGYGALTVDKGSLPIIIAYAIKQKEHHNTGNLVAVYENIDDDESPKFRPAP